MIIALLIICAIIGLMCGSLFLTTTKVQHDQKSWDQLYQQLIAELPTPVPEEVIYNLVLKIQKVTGVILAASIIGIIACALILIF